MLNNTAGQTVATLNGNSSGSLTLNGSNLTISTGGTFNGAWNNGTAVSYALRLGDLERFHVPGFITHNLLISNIMTLGTLALEASLAVLIWNRKARPYVLVLGVFMHVAIALNIMVGFFSMAILTAYVAFIPPDTMTRVIERARLRFRRSAEIKSVDASPVATPQST